jgi:hypothetical protein
MSVPGQPDDDDAPSPNPHRRVFVTTRWTVVAAASGSADPQARMAMEELCQTYWYPLYA